MSVQSDESHKEHGTKRSSVASIKCHLCGVKFKVWYELINHFAAHIRAERSDKITPVVGRHKTELGELNRDPESASEIVSLVWFIETAIEFGL